MPLVFTQEDFLVNIDVSDFDAQKFARYDLVHAEFVVSGTECTVELTLRGRFHFVLWVVVAS